MFDWVFGFFSDAFYTILLVVGIVLFLAALFYKPIAAVLTGGAAIAITPLLGVFAELAKIVAIVMMVYGGGHLYLAWHDKHLESTWETAQKLAVDAAVEAQRKLGDQAVADAIAQTQSQTKVTTVIKKVLIHDAAQTPDTGKLPIAILDAHVELLRRQSCSRGDKAACAAGTAAALQSP